ncbi:MAG TPA: hypothetical protein VF634_14320, partial [Pyrinomonadaceae bacterium]
MKFERRGHEFDPVPEIFTRMIKAIFFDFNGVVIDDEPLQLKAAQAALEAEGIALTERDYYDSLGMDDLT